MWEESIGEKEKMKEKVLVIIPAFNESEGIERTVNQLRSEYPEYDYVVVNDGSTDNTRDICEKNHFQYIDLPINLGIGGSVQAGYVFAYKNGYDIAVQMDGDGQHDATYLDELITPVLAGDADVTIGSRFIEGEGFQSSFTRRIGIKFLSNLIFITTGKRIKDVTSGYRAINKRFIEIFSKEYPIDYPEPEAIVEVLMHLGTIKEVPVQMRARETGTSSITAKKSFYYMFKVTLAIIICRIGYGVRRAKRGN